LSRQDVAKIPRPVKIDQMTSPAEDKSMLVRGAVAVGRTLGSWQQRRIAAAQDAYVESWKAAWTEGCNASWAGDPVTAIPFRQGPQRDAWMAGWNWAQTQPDRRDPSRADSNGPAALRRNAERRRHLVSAAKGGALSLTVYAAARWFSRLRSRADNGENAAR
jgi:hypothetical protein